MVYGDGNKYFDQFVRYPGIAAHEIWHGVTGERLAYQDEAGALNESYSDVMGACCLDFVDFFEIKKANLPI